MPKKWSASEYTGPEDKPIEPVYPEEYLLGGVGGKAVSRGISAIGNKLLGPKVVNKIVNTPVGKSSLIGGRAPSKAGDVTHAYRNISTAEREAAQKSGYFEANPANKYAEGKKWWSEGDSKGHFGRDWKNNEGTHNIRTAIDKVPSGRAVKSSNVEMLNKETGNYEPFKKGGVVKSKKTPVKSASSRGDGCAQRGKTRGKVR